MRLFFRGVRRVCTAILISNTVFFCLAGPPAQPGSFTGCVTGPDGARLPGARLVVRQSDSSVVVQVVTGSSGLYRAANLQPGTYEMTVNLEGFAPKEIRGVVLASGEAKVLNFVLEIATIRMNVAVVGMAPRDSMEATEARETSARDVGEALARTSGVWKLRKGGIANDVVLRGYQSKDMNVLIDGERIYGACPGSRIQAHGPMKTSMRESTEESCRLRTC